MVQCHAQQTTTHVSFLTIMHKWPIILIQNILNPKTYLSKALHHPYIIIKVSKLVTNVKDALMNTINMQLKPTCDPRMKNIYHPILMVESMLQLNGTH